MSPRVSYLEKRFREIGIYLTVDKIAAILWHNGCSLYYGHGRIDTKGVKVIKARHYDFAEFEEDPMVKLMLPKSR